MKIEGPVAVLVQFTGTAAAQLPDIVERHNISAQPYTSVPGLISKSFIRDTTTNTVGGMYVFETEEDARNLYATDWWREAITRTGVEPTFRFFQATAYVTKDGVRPRN